MPRDATPPTLLFRPASHTPVATNGKRSNYMSFHRKTQSLDYLSPDTSAAVQYRGTCLSLDDGMYGRIQRGKTSTGP